jgi:hypothetical protein
VGMDAPEKRVPLGHGVAVASDRKGYQIHLLAVVVDGGRFGADTSQGPGRTVRRTNFTGLVPENGPKPGRSAGREEWAVLIGGGRRPSTPGCWLPVTEAVNARQSQLAWGLLVLI